MWEAIQKFADRFESRVSLATWLGTSGAVAVVSGYFGSTVHWINQFGAFGWWMAGLVGFFLASVSLGAVSWARQRWVISAAAVRLAERTDTANPLQREFHKLKINLQDMAHPITRQIRNKRFMDCQILGPGVLVIQNKNIISYCELTNCDAVKTSQGTMIYNGLLLDECEFLRCEFINFIFVASDNLIEMMPGINRLN